MLPYQRLLLSSSLAFAAGAFIACNATLGDSPQFTVDAAPPDGSTPGQDANNPDPDGPDPDAAIPQPVEKKFQGANADIIDPANTVACNQQVNGVVVATLLNSFYRRYSLLADAVPSDYTITSIDVGISSVATNNVLGHPVRFKVHQLNDGSNMDPATWTELAVVDQNLAPQTQTIINVPISAVITVGTSFVVEVESLNDAANNGRFFPGSNSGGQSDVGFIKAGDCNVNAPADISVVAGRPVSLVLNVNGTHLDSAPQ